MAKNRHQFNNRQSIVDNKFDNEQSIDSDIAVEEQDVVSSVEVEVVEVEEVKVKEGTVFNCEQLRVRREPNTNAHVLCTIPKETKLIIKEEESTNEFYKVLLTNGVEGFCMKKFITV